MTRYASITKIIDLFLEMNYYSYKCEYLTNQDRKMSKERQEAIKELIKNSCISDQKQLAQLLTEKYGLQTNQTVISRDLRRLGATKKQVNGSLVYKLPEIDVNAELLKLALIDIDHNESMIVIKTHPGLADFVGDCIDDFAELGVLGCLSGENTVFVTPKSIKQIEKTYDALCNRFHFKQKKKL